MSVGGDLIAGAALVLLTVLASGFFEGTETGITSARRARLLHRARGGHRLAVLAARLVQDRERVIQTAVVGSNLMTVAGSALATVTLTGAYGERGESIATVAITLLSVVFGQIVPKSIFRSHPETLVTWAAAPFWVAMRLLWPVQRLIQLLAGLVLRALGQPASMAPARFTKERILKNVELSYRSQTLLALEEALVRKFAHASQLSLRQVMTPLAEVTAIDDTERVAKALELVRSTAHSRLPMRDGEGRINGLLLFRDLIHARGEEPVETYARTILLVAADMGIDEGIAALSHARASMAAVVDARDQPIGIVTLEDMLVPLVGDIADEHDEVVAA